MGWTHHIPKKSLVVVVSGGGGRPKGLPSISETVNFATLVNLLIQIRGFYLRIIDSSRICRDHLAEDSQDDSQSKYKVSKTYNVVSVVFCSDQWRFIKCIT